MFDAMEYNSWDQADQAAGMAFELYENGDMDMALTQIQEAIDINPNNAAWHFNKGLTLDAMERFEEAVRTYERALEISPDDPEIMNSLAVDYTRNGQYDLALATFERIQQIDPSFEPCFCNRIITYTEIDQHDKAEEMFYLAQQINPDCPICFYNIGNSLFSRQQFERAIWCWQRTAMLEPTHPQINYRIAQAYWAGGDIEEARYYFLEELRNNPGDVDVILDFGIFLLKQNQHDAAREKFNRIAELMPGFALAQFYLGELEHLQDHDEEAEKYYRQAIKRESGLVGPRFRLAQLAVKYEQPHRALELLQEEYELDITDVDVLMSMGLLFMELEETDCAADCFLRIVDEHKDHADAFYGLGKTLQTRGEYEGALQFFEHAVTLGKKDIDTLLDTAHMYLAVGKKAMALKTIMVARMLEPKRKDIRRFWYHIKMVTLTTKIRTWLETTRFYHKLTLLFAGYKCRFRRVINSRRKGPKERRELQTDSTDTE
ncbi:MAG: tetratricopeptide repeat protein [Sedimentisphaerales bacterium]|nr:tetratricopeptide repeat protein [Sedimentisphaerales bacterium]